jgi:DNA replication protein DnaC
MIDETPPTIADTLAEFRQSAGGSLARALAKVATETPEQGAADFAEVDAAALRAAAAERAEYRRRRYEEARPKVFAFATFDSLIPQQDPDGKGRRWLASGHKIALLVGPSGHGKTFLAYTIGNHAVREGLWVEAWSASELFQALAPLPTHARADEARSRRQENILESVKDCDLLILDDLGAEAGSGYVADQNVQVLTGILDARDTNPRCRNVVTLNGDKTAHLADDPPGTQGGKTRDEKVKEIKLAAANSIAVRYGARVATRLQNDMIGIWVEGEGFRKAAAWDPFA